MVDHRRREDNKNEAIVDGEKIEVNIRSLLSQSNQHFNAKQFDEAAVKAEKAYSLYILIYI